MDAQRAVYGNRRRIHGVRGRRLQRQRSKRVERPFAHQFETGGLRRIFIRGHPNVRQRLLAHVCGFNLALLMRHLTGFRDDPQPTELHGGVYLGAIGLLSRLGAFAETLLSIDPARSIDSRVPNPSLRYQNVNVRIEHLFAKSGLLPRADKVRDAIRLLKRDGWRWVRTRGSHRHYKHPEKLGTVTIAGRMSNDLAPGTWNSILKQAGLDQGESS